MLEKLGFQALVEETITCGSRKAGRVMSLYQFVLGIVLGLYGGFQRAMRQRVWEAASVKLKVATIDTDTTVHTPYGKQMGARKSYPKDLDDNPKNKGKLSYQPILIPLSGTETREYLWGELRRRGPADRRARFGII